MGLKYPRDLDQWRQWQGRRHLLRTLKSSLSPTQRPSAVWHSVSDTPDIAIVLDSLTPSNRAALLTPLAFLPLDRVAVLAPAIATPHLPPARWLTSSVTTGPLLRDTVRSVLSAAHYLPLGESAYAEAGQTGAHYHVIQHGLLTPFAPPLPPDASALVWSDQDGHFWQSGRTDVGSRTVGSQLLWEAGSIRAAAPEGPPVWLGQLHGAELPRAEMARAAEEFCRMTNARYRPHPAEQDRRSRRQHQRWAAAGITLDLSGTRLSQIKAAVASVVSPGVLEAAAMGLPAWVYHPDPPRWLSEFWDRYMMQRWGGAQPTPEPPRDSSSPAEKIALYLLGDTS